MRVRRLLQIAAVAVLTVSVQQTPAISQSGMGAFLGFNVDFHHPMAGVQARFDLSDVGFPLKVILSPSAESFINLGVTELYQIDLDLLFVLPRIYPQLEPFAGVGLGITRGEAPLRHRIEDRNHESLNLLLGAQVEYGQRVIPFAQVRVSLVEDNDHTSVLAGAYIRL